MLARLKRGLKAWVGRLTGSGPIRVLEGTEVGHEVDILPLVCPLRYDIVVKRDFCLYCEAAGDRYVSDFDGFLAAPEAQAYYRFIREVRILRYTPSAYNDEEEVLRQFRWSAERCKALCRSLATRGFDVSTPITLQAGLNVQHETGVRVDAPYYGGDGCHRLAWLWAHGYSRLPPAYYRVAVYRTCRPLDTTAELIRALPLAREAYVRYLATYYADGQEVGDLDGLVAYVKNHNPHKLDEVTSVIHEHSRFF